MSNSIHYKISIEQPQTHFVQVRVELDLGEKNTQTKWQIFMPSWSPGSYLMREYARYVRSLKAFGPAGERLHLHQIDKGTWEIDTQKSLSSMSLEYEVYCHELTVRTSWVDETHAFLQGPTYLMGVVGWKTFQEPNGFISFRFSQLWSKISTALTPSKKEIDGWEFNYEFTSYDELLDCPVEIGCHETDGFLVKGKPHHLASYGTIYPHTNSFKNDIQKIIETIVDFMGGEMPYKHYHFINHFLPGVYGGLEHANSTVLQFDGRKLGDRKEYVAWLGLVSHEYFHLWNVKRIRPLELGPFNYQSENYTSMLWLAEGLTAFMDNYFLLLSGLISSEEYLELIKKSLNNYFKTHGRKFESLEGSSFNAWVKLYRPHENSHNMTISYYLKGEFLFLWLAAELLEFKSSIKEFVHGLWLHYQRNPMRGITKEEVGEIVENLSDKELKDQFLYFVEGTEDFAYEKVWSTLGISKITEDLNSRNQYQFGFETETRGENIFVRTVMMDGAAYQQGLNAGDEIIAFHGVRLSKNDISLLKENLLENQAYNFLISRNGKILNLNLYPKAATPAIKDFKIQDLEKWNKFKSL
ncbi:MAG: hypothetical protein QE271_04300 [Bacteriovoracaceae bacterium]|nr:hypothetical protein [Bacteriovoracaceae bacterium]